MWVFIFLLKVWLQEEMTDSNQQKNLEQNLSHILHVLNKNHIDQ